METRNFETIKIYTADPALAYKIINLEKCNTKLNSRMVVSTTNRSRSTDLVIGGLSVLKGVDLEKLVPAVLNTVHSGMKDLYFNPISQKT